MTTTKPQLDIQPDRWILMESLTYHRFGHPKKVTKVSGNRVYWARPNRHKGEIEDWSTGYCARSSVLHVVESEEAGMAAFDEQKRLSDILDNERKESLERFRSGMNRFFEGLES